MRTYKLLSILLMLLLALAACNGQAPTPTPEPTEAPVETEQTLDEDEAEQEEVMEKTAVTNAVTVSDQELGAGNIVTIDSVTADAAGWLVIHAQADGKPGPIIGHAPVAAGENSDVVVEIDPAAATDTLYAMLHVDAGTEGEYEFPGDDVPATDAAGNIVTPAFQLSDASAGAPTGVSANVMIQDSRFVGADLTVTVGTTVIWRHEGNISHTVTADDGSFDSGTMGGGDVFEFTFTEAGTFPYYCRFHGGPGGAGMSGTITVTEG